MKLDWLLCSLLHVLGARSLFPSGSGPLVWWILKNVNTGWAPIMPEFIMEVVSQGIVESEALKSAVY